MEVGIKIYPDRIKHINQLSEVSDFIEIMASPDLNPLSLKKFSNKFTIHAQHNFSTFGVNPANRKKASKNKKAIKLAQKAADITNADIIVLHPGILEDRHCSIENAVDFINKLNDSRIIIENDPSKFSLLATPRQAEFLTKATGLGFCFDFGHAVAVAAQIKKDYKNYTKQFMKLNPCYFHIYDGHVKLPYDEHLNFWKGDFDLNFLKSLIPKNSRVALETEQSSPEVYKKMIDFLKK